MRKPIYFLILLLILIANADVNAEELCSNELFSDEIVSRLFWQEEGQSFVVGLGEPSANEYTFDYKLIRFDDQGIDISDYENNYDSLVRDLVSDLGISERFYDYYGDSTDLFFSPDYQYAIYLQDNQLDLNIFNLGTGTFSNITLSHAVGEIEQVYWIDDEKFIFVTSYPYGIGHEIIEGCLDQDCLRYITDSLNAPIGLPAISSDYALAIGPSFTNGQNTFLLIDLIPEDESTYEEIHVPFATNTSVSPVWPENKNEVYVIGSETTFLNDFNIYRLTFEGETAPDIAQIVKLDIDLASSTSMWLVDPINQLSIHALRNGGLRILCWG